MSGRLCGRTSRLHEVPSWIVMGNDHDVRLILLKTPSDIVSYLFPPIDTLSFFPPTALATQSSFLPLLPRRTYPSLTHHIYNDRYKRKRSNNPKLVAQPSPSSRSDQTRHPAKLNE